MTARTYRAAEMRSAFMAGWSNGHDILIRDLAEAEAERRWPDPAPEPPAMTVREEPDPDDDNVLWRWQKGKGMQYRDCATPSPWMLADRLHFSDDSYSIARLALLADLAAFPNRLHDGRPCTLKGVAKP